MDFVHTLLGRAAADGASADGLLGELAAAFAGSGAGLAVLATGKVAARRPADDGAPPWEDDSELAGRALRSPAALTLPRRGGGRILLTAVRAAHPGWLLWVESDDAGRAWNADEAAALTLAGLALGRLLDAREARPRWAAQLERAERQRDLETAARVSARLAHDFGNVLTGIIGFCDLSLALKLPADSQLGRYLRELQRCAQNGAQLTQLLRLFSRRQAGGVQPCEPGPLVAEESARATAAGGGFAVRTDLADGLPPVAADAGQLRQVLAALLENARDAMQGAGTATVVARPVELTADDCLDLYGDARPGPHVEIAVADAGPGLPADVADNLFAEPFFAAKPRRRGFGLAVSYGILHAHHGGLRLKAGPTGGTVASVYLPRAVPPRPAPAAAPTQAPRGERVLVVDDDAMILRFICATLEQAGYRVQGAADAESALAHYASAAPDRFRLVLCDVFMPKVTGVELARRLLARDPAARLLFMSGKLPRDCDCPDFPAQGFEFLSKPFRTEGLLRAVRGAIERPAPSGGRPAETAGAAR